MNININNILKSDIIPPSGYLSSRLLVATPLINSPAFNRSVILMCAHDSEGAMGIIINRVIENIAYKDIFQQLSIAPDQEISSMPVHYGGPVEMNRGFIIYDHDEFPHPETMLTVNNIAVSCSVSILREIAEGKGPSHCLLALGYTGWAAGQLEAEMEANSWISVPATTELVFQAGNSDKWKLAAQSNGIDISRVTGYAGHA